MQIRLRIPVARSAQQIDLNAQHIAIAAGVVQDRFNADLLLDQQ